MCEHSYTFLRTENYYKEYGHYSYEYVSIDYFFCSKCAHEKINKKQFIANRNRLDQLPDWAKVITNKIWSYE